MSGDSQWMLPSEIFVYLCELFPGGGKILEFGSGDGTRILAERFDICSIEHDEAWAEKLDTECHLIPIKSNRVSTENGQTGWYDVDEVLKVIPKDLDIVIIDGPNGTIGRHGILSVLDSLPKALLISSMMYTEMLKWIYTKNWFSGMVEKAIFLTAVTILVSCVNGLA